MTAQEALIRSGRLDRNAPDDIDLLTDTLDEGNNITRSDGYALIAEIRHQGEELNRLSAMIGRYQVLAVQLARVGAGAPIAPTRG